MTELVRLQEQFQKFLLVGESDINDAIVQTEIVSIDTRLAIYRDAYVQRLIESLTANFPFLYSYLGTEEFNRLAQAYISAHPSCYRSIRWFGDVLADFVKNYYRQNPHLAELADFEWNMTLIFDAADALVVRIEDMAVVPVEAWANLQFILHPSVRRVNYFWNVIPLWQKLAHDEELPDLHYSSSAIAWVLWRSPEYLIQFYSLSQQEAWALDALIRGSSFAELCEGLCQWTKPEDVALCAASYLKSWIQHGLLSQLVNS
ncbi:DNA-binding domain-containing protein [Legionella sp.]|uniref:HvfC/BufC N-terminal domain-containing protein n=1 Tax=Legionella sp. TaxID=459 RepID=UPI003CA73009